MRDTSHLGITIKIWKNVLYIIYIMTEQKGFLWLRPVVRQDWLWTNLSPFSFVITFWLRPVIYDFIHRTTPLENPILISLCNSLVSDMVSNALLKSNCKRMVSSCFSLSIPALISSVNYNRVVCVLWPGLNPDWKGSRIFIKDRNANISSCTSFSKTLDKKLNSATGRKSVTVEGIESSF